MPSKSTPLGEDGSGSQNGSHPERDEAITSTAAAANETSSGFANGARNGARPAGHQALPADPNENEPDSEAETVRLDSSPVKKRSISEQLPKTSKRARPASPGEQTRHDEESGDEARIPSKDDISTSKAINTNGNSLHSGPASSPAASPRASPAASPTSVPAKPLKDEENETANGDTSRNEDDSRNGVESEREDNGHGQAEDAGADSAPESGEESNADSDEEAQSMQKERQEAIVSLTEIEVEFAHLRDELFEEHLRRYDLEIQMCEEGTHPELATVYDSIQSRHNERVERGQAQRDYRLGCLRNQTVAMRAHMHQQFIKDRFDLRSEMLDRTTAQWYKVNYAHRAADRVADQPADQPAYANGYVPPPELSAGVPAANPNVMAALQSYVGFPAAPAVAQASEMEAYEDLAAMGIRSI